MFEGKQTLREALWAELRDKKILILGFGREGRSTYNFIRSMSEIKEIAIADRAEISDIADNYLRVISGEDYLAAVDGDFDLIIKSPGISLKGKISSEAEAKITCQTDLLIKLCAKNVIGITGTKGKSTTSTALDFVLRKMGQKSVLVGNIGRPAWEAIDEIDDETFVVMELSAHQLEFAHYSPHIGVILNLFEEHLDFYGSVAAYHNAKKNLVKFMQDSDFALLGSGIEAKTAAKVINLADLPQKHIQTHLIGEHNQNNLNVVLEIVRLLGLNVEVARVALVDFRGLPHRLEYVATVDGVKYYDDSISTTPETTIAAIKALGDVYGVILGGLDRGINYAQLAEYLVQSNVHNFYLLPETDTRMAQAILAAAEAQGLIVVNNSTDAESLSIIEDGERKYYLWTVENLTEAVRLAKENTPAGYSVLLSPAAASYNNYKNFEERGEHFQELVRDE